MKKALEKLLDDHKSLRTDVKELKKGCVTKSDRTAFEQKIDYLRNKLNNRTDGDEVYLILLFIFIFWTWISWRMFRHLDDRIDGVRKELSNKIDGVRKELSDKVDSVRTQLSDNTDGVRKQLSDKIEKCSDKIDRRCK